MKGNPKKDRSARRPRAQFPNQKRANEVPFKRAREIFELIGKAHALLTSEERRAALAAIPPYRSRGHGRGRQTGPGRELMDRSKYNPRVQSMKHARARAINALGLEAL